jgi:hypothetical protein
VIRVINSSRNYALANYQYEPQFRALYPASGTDTGIYIQVGVKSSGTETGSIVYYMNENAVFSDSVLGFNLYTSVSGTADGTPTYLPDGLTAPVAGMSVYGFGHRNILIWSGNESVSNSTYSSTFFTGFSNQMFDKYLFLYSGTTGNDDLAQLLISSRAYSSSNHISVGLTSPGGDVLSCRIQNDTYGNDFSFIDVGGVDTFYLRYIYGAGI